MYSSFLIFSTTVYLYVYQISTLRGKHCTDQVGVSLESVLALLAICTIGFMLVSVLIVSKDGILSGHILR